MDVAVYVGSCIGTSNKMIGLTLRVGPPSEVMGYGRRFCRPWTGHFQDDCGSPGCSMMTRTSIVT